MKIKDKNIGKGHKPFVIAEVAQAHDGSLGFAHSFIDAVSECGADAIKFQTHIASAESTKDEMFRVPMSGQDASRYDYWKRMEFTKEQWVGLSRHAAEKKIIFLSSAFSVEAVCLLQKLDMPAYKIGSGEFKSIELINAILDTKKPILFSTGMSRYDEVKTAADTFDSKNASFALFQCTSRYPTPLEEVGMNVLDEYRKAYGCPVGLSDHSGTPYPALMAMAKGADLIEVHVTFDRRLYGPDSRASVTFDEFRLICDARDAFHKMESRPVDKDKMAQNLDEMRSLFTKSIAVAKDCPAGTILTEEMLIPKKPGTGISYKDMQAVVGRRLKRDVAADRLLRLEDIE
jgi:N,N'-diacetyllegionaminate synthase